MAEVAVVSGGLAPRQPAPTSAEGPFDGWVTGPPGAEEPFRFESTVITTDLVVRATSADTRIVQFLAGPAGEDADRIIDADEVRDGEPLGRSHRMSPRSRTGRCSRGVVPGGRPDPDALRFRCSCHGELPAGADPRLRLRGVVRDRRHCRVPEFVVEPDTTFTAADLAAIPPPTRTGYTFTQWWADAARAQPVDLPLTDTATLYAGWQGEDVEYHVSYWLEKPNVVPESYPAPVFTAAGATPPAWTDADGRLSDAQLADPANFLFLDDIASTATAGSTVGARP